MGLTIGKTLLKHKRVRLFVSSLKKTVMKLRPQVQGPIDVGWLLTIYLQNNENLLVSFSRQMILF